MQPLVDASLLPDSNAQYSENTWLYRGLIRGFRHAALSHTCLYTDTKQVYRIPLNTNNPPDFTDTGSLWLEYPDPFMATIRNPTINDTYNRYYFFPSDQYSADGSNPIWGTGAQVPMYNTLARIQASQSNYVLGIPIPSVAPIVVPAPDVVTQTATAPSPPGDGQLTVGSTTNILPGMIAFDTTVTTTVATTSAASAAGVTTITLTSVSGIYVGMKVTNASNPATILSGTTVATIAGLVVTLTNIVLDPGVNIGDQFTFVNSNQIVQDTAVKGATSSTQLLINVPTTYAGVLTGDVLTFSTPIPETRAYVYTYVSAYGEEGPPSPADVETGDPTGPWTITVYNPSSSDMANRNLTRIRIYRTVTDSSGNASYYQVTGFAITGSPGDPHVYTDQTLSQDITANLQLSSVDFTAPPSDLQGVVMMANGIAAGFRGKEVWFSSPFQLWAWPAAYALSVEYTVVGLSPNGSSVCVLTEGTPFIITGVTPGTMTIAKISANEPCIGRGSIAESQEGAFYASPNGVMVLTAAGVSSTTQSTYEKEYHFMLQPWNWAAGRYGNGYVSFVKGTGIPNIDPDGDDLNGFVIDSQDANVSFSFINFVSDVRNLYQDELSGQLFGVFTDGTVLQWNPPVGNPGTTTLYSWEWKSKKFRFVYPQQFKAFLIYFEVPPEVMITLGPRNTDPNQIFNPATQYMIAQIFADGNLLTTREIQKSGEVLMITHGSKWTYWEIRLQGQVSVRMYKMASSVKELKAA